MQYPGTLGGTADGVIDEDPLGEEQTCDDRQPGECDQRQAELGTSRGHATTRESSPDDQQGCRHAADEPEVEPAEPTAATTTRWVTASNPSPS